VVCDGYPLPKTGRFNTFELADNGTLDTVVACSECGQELRYNWDDGGDPGEPQTYESFTEWAKLDAAEQHEEKV
jgi:RNase P subunit RPR2